MAKLDLNTPLLKPMRMGRGDDDDDSILLPASPSYSPAGDAVSNVGQTGWDVTSTPKTPSTVAASNATHDLPTQDADAVQAHGDAAAKIPTTQAQAEGRDENSTTTDQGYRIPKYENSWGAQLAASMGNAFVARLAGKSLGASIAIGSAAVQDLNNKAYRSKQADSLIKDGYAVPDVAQWVESGDNKALAQNIGYQTRNIDGKPVRMTASEWARYDESKMNLALDQKKLNEPGKQMLTVHGGGPNGEDVTVPAEDYWKQKQESEAKNQITPYQQAQLDIRQQEAQAKQEKANKKPELTANGKIQAAGRFHTDNAVKLKEFDLRAAAGNQIQAMASEHKKGNPWADPSILSNFQKSEAPNLSPRQSQIDGMLGHTGSSWNAIKRSIDRGALGQQLTDDDVANIKVAGQVQQYVAYQDLAPERAQRKGLIDEGIPESYLKTIPKPKGYDEWAINGDVSDLVPVRSTKQKDGIYRLGGKLYRAENGMAYTLPED